MLYVKDTVVGPQVSGFAFSNGSGNWIGSYTYGGAILIENGSLVLADSIIVSNSSSDGAGGIVYAWNMNGSDVGSGLYTL